MEGNKKSLVDAMEKGINLREHILKLFSDYYHGGLMKLTVIGGGEVFPLLVFLSYYVLYHKTLNRGNGILNSLFGVLC